MPVDPTTIQAMLERMTLVTVLGWIVIAFIRGWIVPGDTVDRFRAEITDWKARHDKIATIAEAALRARVGQ